MDEDSFDFSPHGEALSPLERLDRIIASIPPGDMVRGELIDLRVEIGDLQDTMAEARQAIEKMDAIIKKVTSPANRIGTFLGTPNRETAQIVVGGSDYYCNVDPRVPIESLRRGTRVLVNEAYVIVGDLGFDRSGPVVKISEVLGPDRLRVGTEHGMQSLVLQRGDLLLKEKLKAGDEVRTDPNYKIAIEVLARPHSDEYYLDSVPELPWEKVGGQQEALRAIRDAIELPLLHPDLFKRFQHSTPKGFLLHGPPGCGKTLIGKATAYNLTQQLKQQTGEEMREYFMHIKGPEILNMWVGESERMVREIFATAREKRREGYLPFLFIDEAESILGTRRASRYSNILSTLVPMFCTEMDGIESLAEVVIILASNRADLIDPAILRPGRIDRKIKVARPTREGAREIYRIYLAPNLPYDPGAGEGSRRHSRGHRPADRQAHRPAIRASRREPFPQHHPALRQKGNALPRRPDQRRDHRQHRRARQGSGHQARHRQRAGRGHQPRRPARLARRRISGERHLPARRSHRGLAATHRPRPGKRGQGVALSRERQIAGREIDGHRLSERGADSFEVVEATGRGRAKTLTFPRKP